MATYESKEEQKGVGINTAPDTLYPEHQFVWSERYIDAPVVRWRDGNTDGDLADVGDDTLY